MKSLEPLEDEVNDRINLIKELLKVANRGSTSVMYLPSPYEPNQVMVTFELFAPAHKIDIANARHSIKMARKTSKNTPKINIDAELPELDIQAIDSITNYIPIKHCKSSCDECTGCSTDETETK